MVKHLDPDFHVRVVRPSYSPSNRPARAQPRPQSTQPTRRPVAVTTSMPNYGPPMPTRPKPKQPQFRFIVASGALAVFVLVSFLVSRGLHSNKNTEANAEAASSTQTAQVAGASTTTAKAVDQAQLTGKINAILASYKGVDTGVSVIGLRDGTSYDYGDDAAYYAASVSKLVSASAFLKQVETGKYTLNTQVAGKDAKTQLEKLIVDSDNDAWHGFIDLLTKPELEKFAKTYGVTFDAEKNTLNVHDTTVFIQKLYQNKILNRSNTKLLLGYMGRASSDQYLEANAPDGATVYQKAGWLSDRLHVAGVVTNGNTGYAVAIFSKVTGTYDYSVGAKLIQQIQTVLNETYF